MIASAIIAVVAFTTIAVVTIVLANRYQGSKIEVEGKLRNVVDQVNTSQQYSYEFDKRQQQQMIGFEKDLQDVKTSYVKKIDADTKVQTKQLNADNIESSGQVKLTSNGWNTGAVQFNSSVQDASRSPDYVIQRGVKPDNMNQIVIKTPPEKGSGVNVMSSDGRSHLRVDSTTGQVDVSGNLKTNTLQLGDKFKISGVGDTQANDGWLRFFGADGKDYYGGIATGSLYSKNGATLNGTNNFDGMNNITGNLYLRGGTSEHNLGKWQTHFPYTDGKNYIRGDTEMRGNTNNIGDLTVGRNMNVTNKLNVQGPTMLNKSVKINHNNNDWTNDAPLSTYAEPGKPGASFGSKGWSHFPWSDGNTYIRPGQENKKIFIGDWGASSVNIGKGDTSTNINGTLSVNGGIGGWNWLKMYKNEDDQLLFGADNTNRGISSQGPRDFNIYTSGESRLTIDKDGKIFHRGDTMGSSIGRAQGDNAMFRINPANAANDKHPGTAAYQGISIVNGGGLNVGDVYKAREGVAVVRDSLQIRFPSQYSYGADQAAIVTWTPDNTKLGPAFGGPANWSFFPFIDGNTYIRSGKDQGRVVIGDTGTSQVVLGSDVSENKLGENSMIPAADGHTYIRPGRNGQNVNIGDTLAKDVNLGRIDGSGSVVSRPNNTYVRRYLDAWDGSQGGKMLYTGWNSDKVVLGNNKTSAQNYIDGLPLNSVASANDLYVYGNAVARNSLCINKTCLNENDLIRIKSLV